MANTSVYGYARMPRIIRKKYPQVSKLNKLLYMYLRDICGESGVCFRSIRSLAKETDFSIGYISKNIPVLQQAGLIHAELKKRSSGKGWEVYHISIVDIWDLNAKFLEEEKCSRDEHFEDINRSHEEQIEEEDSKTVHSMNTICSQHEQNIENCSQHEQSCSQHEQIEHALLITNNENQLLNKNQYNNNHNGAKSAPAKNNVSLSSEEKISSKNEQPQETDLLTLAPPQEENKPARPRGNRGKKEASAPLALPDLDGPVTQESLLQLAEYLRGYHYTPAKLKKATAEGVKPFLELKFSLRQIDTVWRMCSSNQSLRDEIGKPWLIDAGYVSGGYPVDLWNLPDKMQAKLQLAAKLEAQHSRPAPDEKGSQEKAAYIEKDKRPVWWSRDPLMEKWQEMNPFSDEWTPFTKSITWEWMTEEEARACAIPWNPGRVFSDRDMRDLFGIRYSDVYLQAVAV